MVGTRYSGGHDVLSRLLLVRIQSRVKISAFEIHEAAEFTIFWAISKVRVNAVINVNCSARNTASFPREARALFRRSILCYCLH